MSEYAALSKTPRALADALMLAFQHPADAEYMESDFGVKPPAGVPSCVIPGVTCTPFLVEFGGHFKL
jgi:hypothetical protein